MTCDKCKHLKILCEPSADKLWDTGRVICEKRHLITDFPNRYKFNRLGTCDYFELSESKRGIERVEE